MQRIQLLGGVGIGDSDASEAGAASIPRARMALFVALALCDSRSASREALMALLWPEKDAERARHLLREYLYRLRATIGEEAVVATGHVIRLDPSRVACDVWEFEAAIADEDWAAADGLYKGPLLDAVFLSDSPEFEQWVTMKRAQLAESHAKAIEALAAEYESRADWLSATSMWRRRSNAQPLSARVTVRLMESLARAGDRAAALRCAAAHASLLQSELGAAPDASVTELAKRLRASGETSDSTSPAAMVASAAAVGTVAPVSSEASAAAVRPWTRPRRRLSLRVSLVAAAVVVTGAIAVRGMSSALDVNRVAIVPFRVSASDPSLLVLQDGLVELLSLEFSRDVGPAAVDAGESLRAWRRVSGGGAATTDAVAREAARRVRAGRVVVGSVVGSPERFTVSASVIDAATGDRATPTVQVTGMMDSLASVVAELAAKLQSRNAGAWTLTAGVGDSRSTEALRAYLRGMVAYRAGNWVQAGMALFEAIGIDSTFTQAAYRFALIHAIIAPTTPLGQAPSRDERMSRLYLNLWNQRNALTVSQRLLLEAVADSHYVLWRAPALPKLERVVMIVDQSAEAWDILGDDYYHAGALTGREDWRARAKAAFLRARDIDPAIAVNARRHLPDIAFLERDARAHDRYASAALGSRGAEYYRYQSALLSNDPLAMHRARVEYSRAWARNDAEGIDWALRGLTVPVFELDSLIVQLARDAATPEQQRAVLEWSVDAAMMSGRPASASRALMRLYKGDTLAVYSALVDYTQDDSVAAAVLPGTKAVDAKTQTHPVGCNVALSRLRRGDSSGVADLLKALPRLDARLPAAEAVRNLRRGLVGQAALCGQVLEGVRSATAGEPSPALHRADSLLRLTTLNYGDLWNYDIAVALARRGEYGLAAAAARRRFVDLLPEPRLVPSLRQEGRWAALAGDTASAIAAYRHYLTWRAAPEPGLISERDSVRAELAALERQRWHFVRR